MFNRTTQGSVSVRSTGRSAEKLMHMCRVVVRKMVDSHQVLSLPVPAKLQRYLRYREHFTAEQCDAEMQGVSILIDLTYNGPITRILRYWLASLKDQSRKIFVIDTYFRYRPLLGNNRSATGSLHVGFNCKWWTIVLMQDS